MSMIQYHVRTHAQKLQAQIENVGNQIKCAEIEVEEAKNNLRNLKGLSFLLSFMLHQQSGLPTAMKIPATDGWQDDIRSVFEKKQTKHSKALYDKIVDMKGKRAVDHMINQTRYSYSVKINPWTDSDELVATCNDREDVKTFTVKKAQYIEASGAGSERAIEWVAFCNI